MSSEFVEDLARLDFPDGDGPIPTSTSDPGTPVRLAPLTLDEHLFEPRGRTREGPVDPGGVRGKGPDVVDHEGRVERIGEEVMARRGESERGDLHERGKRGRGRADQNLGGIKRQTTILNVRYRCAP